MDREISPKELRKKTNRRWWYGAAALVLLLVGIFMLRNALGNTVQRSAIRIAVAETGNVENTLTASGEVLPEFEQIVTSPVSAVLQQVYFSTGATVQG